MPGSPSPAPVEPGPRAADATADATGTTQPGASGADGDATARTRFDALLRSSAQALSRGAHRLGAEHAQLVSERADLPEPMRARALQLLAQHQWRLGLFEDAAISGRQALLLWQRADDPAAVADTECLLATAFTELGLHEQALRHASNAFDVARRHQLAALEGLALNRMGICHERLGDPEHGEQYMLRALALAEAQHDADAQSMALNNLAAVAIGGYHLLRQRGENDVAHAFLERGRVHAQRVLEIVERGSDVYRRVVVMGNVGEILALLGDFDAAERLLLDTIATARTNAYRAVELRTRSILGDLRAAQGRHDDALRELLDTLEGLRQHEHEPSRLRVHRALHRSYKALGRFEQALAHFETYHAMEMQRAALLAQAQARLTVSRQDIDHALRSAGEDA